MLRIALAAVFASIASAVLAAGWDSGMVEDEGGPAMMAWVYGDGGDVPPELRMMCGDGVNLRYGMGSGPGEGTEPVTEPLTFTFDFGGLLVQLPMQYEDMDGMYSAYVSRDSAIIGLLQFMRTVSIDDPTGTWREQMFTLEGSSKAIGALLATCD
ncbi:MAG TPA: hypothetical protein VG757_02755 [Devosia sp.]|nr:hypothetical protein [Devosia sp.]